MIRPTTILRTVITVFSAICLTMVSSISSRDHVEMNCTQGGGRLQLSAKNGTIVSGPAGLFNYQSRISCYLTLVAQSDKYRVLFTRKKFLLDSIDDYLEIDNIKYVYGKFPDTLMSKKNKVKIYFKTDGKGVREMKSKFGFKIHFQEVAYCGEPEEAMNGTYSKSDYIKGNNSTLSCSNGYNETGVNMTVVCGPDGKWSGSSAQCVPLPIPLPSTTEKYSSTAPPYNKLSTTEENILTDGTTAGTTVPSEPPTGKNENSSASTNKDDNTGLICGIIVAAVVVVIIIIVALVLWRRKKKKVPTATLR